MKTLFSPLFLLLFGTHIFSQSTFVFFGSYNKDTSTEGIYVYRFDTITGVLSFVSGDNTRFNPTFLTLSHDGKYLYACTESKTPGAGSVSSYRFDPSTGRLTYLNSQKSEGENPVYLSVSRNGKWLINGNYTESGISVYPLRSDGKIDSVTQVIHFSKGSNQTERQDRSHIHAVIFSPDQHFVFFPDLGSDKIRSFEFDPDKSDPLGSPDEVASVAGSGPRHLIFHPNGKFAYCVEELSGTVTAYKYGGGKLDSIQRITAHTKDYKGLVMSSDIHISPDGKFLYASNRGDQNNISIFSIKGNGTLKEVGEQSTFGIHPRIFCIDPSGKFLIVTNLVSGNVVVFRRESDTGQLINVGGEIKINNVSCVTARKF